MASHTSSLRGSASLWRELALLLRIHQWAKNVLIFVPMLLAHEFELATLLDAGLAFLVFSLVASSAYVLNDVTDIESDRQHRRKRDRPFASGVLPVRLAFFIIPALLVTALLLSLSLPPTFLAAIAIYYVLTCLYSFRLRRMLMIDVVALGCLYAVRLVAGGVATGVTVSEWLTGFAIFFFLSLALVKRYTELVLLAQAGEVKTANRSYAVSDLSVIIALAAAAGFNAVTILTRYLSSDEVVELYRHPDWLWSIVPVLIYWISRLLILAHRLKVHDDPVVFAIKDGRSWLCGAVIGVIIIAAA